MDCMAKNACPVCEMDLTPALVATARFECPSCGTKLRLSYSPLYRWTRGLVCIAAAFAYMWQHGFHDSFMVFVISFAIWPALKIWDAVIRPMYPPDRIVPVQGPVLTLGLQQ